METQTPEESGTPGRDLSAPAIQESQAGAVPSSGPHEEEAVDESGASSGGGAQTDASAPVGLHGVADEQAEASGAKAPAALDADSDSELPARLVDTDGDGTADDAVVNTPAP